MSRLPAVLTEELIKKHSGQYDVELVGRLSLRAIGLARLENLERCAALTELDVSGNKLTVLEGIGHLKQLRMLNCANNRISRIEPGLAGMTSLVDVRLEGNQLQRVADLEPLAAAPNVRHLRLCDAEQAADNPLCRELAYQSDTLRLFERLWSLDGIRFRSVAGDDLAPRAASPRASSASAPPALPPVDVRSWFEPGELETRLPEAELDTKRFQAAVDELRAALAKPETRG